MNAPAKLRPMVAERAIAFSAWRGNRPAEGLELCLSFEEAIAAVSPGTPHKAFVSIMRHDAIQDRREVRFYAAKKSTKKGIWRPSYDGGPKVFEGLIELHQVGAFEVDAFAPTPPFDAFRDPVAGRSLKAVIDYRSITPAVERDGKGI